MSFPVSFIITSYNKAQFLPSVLASVLSEAEALGGQIILIDDGSSDGSAHICAQFAASQPSVQYLQTANRGVFAALNSVLPLSTGVFARMVDSDDPLVPGSTAAMIDIARRFDVGFVFGRSHSYGPLPLPLAAIAARPYQPGRERVLPDALEYLVLGMNFTSTCALYSANALAACTPLPGGFISCQDLAMTLRAAKVTRFAATEAEVCYYLRGVPNQLIAREALTQHQTAALIRQFWPHIPRALQHRAAAKLAMRARRWRNREHGQSLVDATSIWLFLKAQLAKRGIGAGPDLLRAAEGIYEPELADILARRAVAY